MAKGENKVKEIEKPDIRLRENELLLPTGDHNEDGQIILAKKVIEPVKLKYVTGSKEFLGYQVIEQIGVIEIFAYGDGYDLIKSFLISVFNDKTYVESIIDDLDVEMISEIIRISKKVNRIKEEDDSLKNVMATLKEV